MQAAYDPAFSITGGWLHSEDGDPPGQQETEELKGPQANMTFITVDASLNITSIPCMNKVLTLGPVQSSHLAVSLHKGLQFFACGCKPGLLKPLRSSKKW